MVRQQYNIVWTVNAQKQIKQIFEHIEQESPKNAVRVVEDIVLAVYQSIDNPEIYPSDKYKLDNDGSYRAFERHRYRISYRFSNNIVRVLRVRHTSMKPLKF